MSFDDIENESDRELADISSESSRTYRLSDGRTFKFQNPIALSVSDTAHYVVTEDKVTRVPFDPERDVVKWAPPHFVI